MRKQTIRDSTETKTIAMTSHKHVGTSENLGLGFNKFLFPYIIKEGDEGFSNLES